MKKSLFLATLLISTSVHAQGMSPFGMWEDYKPQRQEAPWSTRVKPSPPLNPSGGARPIIQPEEPEIVSLLHDAEPGNIVIDSGKRVLYLILDDSHAYKYPISVGREGFAWTGLEKVTRIQDWPDWVPPKEMRQRRPDLPERMSGGLNNPLGAKAIYLGDTLYRIHGTNDPKSIGRAESSGCIRMMNAHVVHLAQYVQIGTVVRVW